MKNTFINTALALGITMTGVATTGHAANAAEPTTQHTQQHTQKGNQPAQGTKTVERNHQAADQKGQAQKADKKAERKDDKREEKKERKDKKERGDKREKTEKGSKKQHRNHDKKVNVQRAPQATTSTTAKSSTATTTTAATTTTSTSSSSSSYANASASVKSILAAIAQRESGGNITAINTSSGAAGKYQFLQSTWDTVAPAAWKGKSPASAPESVQDDAALALYNLQGTAPWGV